MSLPEILKTALEQIHYLAKTETIIGEPIVAGPVTLIPVSKVSIGFAAGGTDSEKRSTNGSGTGGGVSVTPIAFISVCGDKVQIHDLDHSDLTLGKLLSMAPELVNKIAKFVDKKKKKEEHDSPPT